MLRLTVGMLSIWSLEMFVEAPVFSVVNFVALADTTISPSCCASSVSELFRL